VDVAAEDLVLTLREAQERVHWCRADAQETARELEAAGMIVESLLYGEIQDGRRAAFGVWQPPERWSRRPPRRVATLWVATRSA